LIALSMTTAHDTLIRRLSEHSQLGTEDEAALRTLPVRARELAPDEDLVREGDEPEWMALVISGWLARYHTRSDGKRQYLSFHMSGDLPDAQALFLETMDHAVCALGKAQVGLIAHEEILELFERRPSIGIAIWRGTLIDAAIFRAAISNLGARPARTRMAHLFCELYYRARNSGLAKQGSCSLPLHQGQLGDALAMSLVTVNRTLQSLRRTGAMQFRNGHLTVHDWPRMTEIAHFDPSYLHIRRPVRL
jgi:CRP-like cAMP-binding protein